MTAGGCEQGGAQIGVDKFLMFLPGTFLPHATSDPVSGDNTTTMGRYCWRAKYLGDFWNNPVSFTNATTQCFTVGGNIFPPPGSTPQPVQIPTLSTWIAAALAACLVLAGCGMLRRRRIARSN